MGTKDELERNSNTSNEAIMKTNFEMEKGGIEDFSFVGSLYRIQRS